VGIRMFDFMFTSGQRFSDTINVFGRVGTYAVFGSVTDTALTEVRYCKFGLR
jgi:hypothetical protein